MMHDDGKYQAAVADLRARGPQVKTRWRHRNGGVYEVVGRAIVEATLTPSVAYRKVESDASGRLSWLGEFVWVRPLDEFLDGRFVPADG